MEKLTVFKWWWGWNSEKVENWLEEMELKGLTLDKVTGLGTRFHFVEGSGEKVRYCIDYQNKLDKEYINLLHDDGWELIPMGAGWYVCRKQYDNQRPNLYIDYDSQIARNKKLLNIVVAGSIPTLAVWPTVIHNNNPFFVFLLSLATIFYLVSIFKLKATNDTLKKKKELKNI